MTPKVNLSKRKPTFRMDDYDSCLGKANVPFSFSWLKRE
jgi:hypothetical protein